MSSSSPMSPYTYNIQITNSFEKKESSCLRSTAKNKDKTALKNHSSINDDAKLAKKYKVMARVFADDLNHKYLLLRGIVAKAKKHAEEANRRQADKTSEALEKVSLAQNKDHPLSIKEINAIRKREYTQAIIEQMNAERANKLANKVELLATHLSNAAKKAKCVVKALSLETY